MTQRSFSPIKTDLLKVLDKHLSVPKYQRPYTWGTENIDLMWEDLYLDTKNSNFLGIVVLHDNNRKDKSGTHRVEIIDGQQRITTATIFLSLIRNLFDSENSTRSADITQKAIEKDNALGSEGYILSPGSKLKDFLELNIQARESRHAHIMSVVLSSLSDEQEKIVRNYRRAFELITGHEKWTEDKAKRKVFLTEIKDRLLNSELIEVTVHSEDDAYDLFETLNSRSVSLSEVNMIKNRIFMMLSSEATDEELERIWGNIEVNSGGQRRKAEDIQKFINYFWWSRYEKVPPKQIFRSLRHEKKLMYILEELEKDSVEFRKLKSTDSSQLVQYRHISLTELCSLASVLNMQQVYIPLLSLARKLASDNYWDTMSNNKVQPLLSKLEKFIFAYKFSERSPAVLERLYSRNAIKIFSAGDRTKFVDNILDFEKDLNEKFPTEDEFKSSFSQLEYIPGASKNNKIVSYALSRIYFGDNNEIRINEADLEHIFPQNPQGGLTPSEVELKSLTNTLGNLTPLSEEINRKKCRNKRPTEKIKYYRSSDIIGNHQIADIIEKKGWNSEKIMARTDELTKKMWQYLNT